MKVIKSLGAIALITLFLANASAQKTVLTNSEIPADIKNYITQNFKEHRILRAIKDIDINKIEYDIILSKKVELEFNETFKIKEIEAKKGVPLNLIPLPIANYIQNHFPDLKVVQWKLNTEGQKIELNNKYEIKFDKNGNFIRTKIK